MPPPPPPAEVRLTGCFQDGGRVEVVCGVPATAARVENALLAQLGFRPTQYRLVLSQGVQVLDADDLVDPVEVLSVVKQPPVPLPVVEEPWGPKWFPEHEAYAFYAQCFRFSQWETPLPSINGWFCGRDRDCTEFM